MLNLRIATFTSFALMALLVLMYPQSYTGSADFIQYWTSFKLARIGLNPYDPTVLLAAQQSLRPAATEPLMMWNGPWILPLLSPILILPFPAAVGVFAALNIAILLLSGVLIHQLLSSRTNILSILSLFAFFFPVWICLALGQISLLLLFGALLLLHGVLRHSNWHFVGGAILATLKPHLFLFLGIVLLSSLARKDRRGEIVTFFSAFGILMGITELWFPGLITAWLGALRSPGAGAVPPPAFTVTTLVGFVRGLLADDAGMLPLWPMIVMPLLPAVGFLIWRVRSKSQFDLATYWPGVLGISYLFSPYGWTFDAVLLLPCHVAAISLLTSPHATTAHHWLARGLIGAQAFAYVLFWIPELKLHHGSYWWLPTLIFIIWLYAHAKFSAVSSRAMTAT